MTKEEHDKIINIIKQNGIPKHYKTTVFGNYTPTVATHLVIDALNDYRYAELNGEKDD